MATIQRLLTIGKTTLQHISESPELDAAVLLAESLQKNHAYLMAHPEMEIDKTVQKRYHAWLSLRETGMPIAYILGKKEFWSLEFNVDNRVLIPRPETELIVERLLAALPRSMPQKIADVGTGCGAIAVAVAHERPQWQVVATDVNPEALTVAKTNAQKHQTNNVEFRQGSGCQPLQGEVFDAIVSNPPYIAEDDPALENGVRRFEPITAVVAAEDGLATIKKIVTESYRLLKPQGWLMIEHGYKQGLAVAQLFRQNQFVNVQCFQDIAGCDRLTQGVKNLL